jgi:hypothetical protein
VEAEADTTQLIHLELAELVVVLEVAVTLPVDPVLEPHHKDLPEAQPPVMDQAPFILAVEVVPEVLARTLLQDWLVMVVAE